MKGENIGYIRVSSDEQGRDGVSLKAQEQAILKFASSKKIGEVRIIQDVASGKDLKRPGIQSVLKLLKEGKLDRLIVWHPDRLTRSVRDRYNLFYDFGAAGVRIESICTVIDQETPEGKLNNGIEAVVSQYYSDDIGRKTKNALKHLREARKVYCHRTPWGWKKDGDSLIPSPEDRKLLMRIKALKRHRVGARRIAHRLNEEGVKTKMGKNWTQSTVERALKVRIQTR